MDGIRRAIPNLTAIRQSRGLSLAQLAESTKISRYYLKAIETGEVSKLPGGVYTRSYIRQYAQAIDYNEDELLGICLFGESERDADARQDEPPGHQGLWSRFLAFMFHLHGLAAGSRRTG
jgi:transcriptional regulator with XRE-family HTH domain